MGFVKGKIVQEESNKDEMPAQVKAGGCLDTIEEESEEEQEDDSDDETYDQKASEPGPGQYRDIDDHVFPQAFSHYAFEKTKKKFMVVDLQGVLQVERDGTRKFMLTDPAIHRKNSKGRPKK